MALFPNPQSPVLYDGAVGKTHTNLVVSEGAAPAERYIVSRDNGADPFIYEYGPEGNQTVLIAKGKIVEAAGTEKDREEGHTATALRVAGEGSLKALGVNHHNVYEQRRDAMEGNRPVVITRSYIEVPLFEAGEIGTAESTAKAMHFGAAYGVNGELEPGDFVMAGKNGNFIKYDGSDFRKVVGQVHRVNRELPPAGLLKYFTGLKNTDLEDYLKQISATPAAGDAGYPYGAPYSVGSWKPEFLKQIAGGNLTGIPFLTDGYFSARQTIEAVVGGENVENTVGGEGVTIEGGTVTVSEDVDDATVMVKLKHKIDPRAFDQVEVAYTGEEGEVKVSTRDVHVDVENNTIVVYLDGGVTATDLTITVASVVNPTAGIPTEWDYSGSVGAARIQLMR